MHNHPLMASSSGRVIASAKPVHYRRLPGDVVSESVVGSFIRDPHKTVKCIWIPMCPPARPHSSPADIGFYWSDEEIFLFLDEYTQGVCLPNNVLAGSSPYLYRPSNLPEGIWYLVNSNEKKESVFGFWKPKAQACKIYSNSVMNGWLSTLEYYEGEAPQARRTDWVMQEYSITQKELFSGKHNPKELTSLCRVFLCNGSNHINATHTKDCKNIIGSTDISSRASLIPKTDNNPEQVSKNEYKANSIAQETADFDCFLRGDYLELNDLEDPESHSSSSQNSSCPSKLSDEYFDSLALLHELEEGGAADTEGKYLSSRYSITTPVKSNDVVVDPPSSGSIFTGVASTSTNELLTAERMLDHSTKGDVNDGSSNFCDANTNAISNREEKENDSGKKKLRLKQYFCFAHF
ncbi:hypothetical protein F511_01062 [Dorcoceras hygrometricum]|uniref:NAC domain-containing protein n=1 Tax=Dorcoceras hygrometricum TaxID=472368 RepID=A0A2Z7AEM6_9LAMI|nr:hypothetical protein F511_01062 [Dorcoceras hygrometricum]